MRRNIIDSDDAVGNGQVFNGSGGNDRFVGRSAEDTEVAVGPGQVGEEFFGGGGSDIFDGRGGNDSFFLNGGDDSLFQNGGNDRVIAAADDGFQAQVFAFESGAGVGDTIDFSAFNANSIDDLTIEEGNAGTLVSADGSQVLNLRGVDIGDVVADDFVFSGNNNNNTVAAPEAEEDVAAAPEANDGEVEAADNVVNTADLNVVDDIVGGNLNGSGADDLIIGSDQRGGELISGAGGNDVIQGNGGFDFISAGAGNDTIIVAADDGAETGVLDFESGSDTLIFAGGDAASLQIEASDSRAGGTDVTVDGFQTVNIQNLAPGEIDVDNDIDFGDVDAAIA